MNKISLCVLMTTLASAFALCPGLCAQDGQMALDPPISDIFPFETLTDGVHVEYPVLLNAHTILRADAVLHFIYLDPNAAAHPPPPPESSGSVAYAHAGPGVGTPSGAGGGETHSAGGGGGWGSAGGNDVAGIYDDRKNDAKLRKDELDHEMWKQKELFDDALEHATELGTVLVYKLPRQSEPQTAAMDLPEGMLLGEVAGHVRVLGLKEESRAFSGGVRPGDEIRSFNGGAQMKGLGDFVREYSTIRQEAETTGQSNYAMEIFRPSTGQPLTVQVAAPPTIPSFLKDSYSAPLDRGQ